MKIGIIDYGVGNLGSIQNTLNFLEIDSVISNNIDVLKKCSGLILPGDGAAGEGMNNLKKMKMDEFIRLEIKNGKPFLGICLGMQLLLEKSEEGSSTGGVECLGIIKGSVEKINTKEKLPQIGWNTIKVKNEKFKMKSYSSKFKGILSGVEQGSYCYFIHSYICKPEDKFIVSAETIYGENFCSAFEKDNIFGLQFHPEKSGIAGRQILKNFTKFIGENKRIGVNVC